MNFYSVKWKYAPKQEGDKAGVFLQLTPGEGFIPNLIKSARSLSVKWKEAERSLVAVSIELRTPTRTMMRNSGILTGLICNRFDKDGFI